MYAWWEPTTWDPNKMLKTVTIKKKHDVTLDKGLRLQKVHQSPHKATCQTHSGLSSSSQVKASHLLTASVMTAPSSLAIGKAFWPETETSRLKDRAELGVDHEWGWTRTWSFFSPLRRRLCCPTSWHLFSAGTVPMRWRRPPKVQPPLLV